MTTAKEEPHYFIVCEDPEAIYGFYSPGFTQKEAEEQIEYLLENEDCNISDIYVFEMSNGLQIERGGVSIKSSPRQDYIG